MQVRQKNLFLALSNLMEANFLEHPSLLSGNIVVAALLEHVVQMAKALHKQQQDLKPIFELIDAILEIPEEMHLLVLKKSLCIEIMEHDYETPLYIATPAAIFEARRMNTDGWLDALQILDRLGFNFTVNNCSGVIIDLGEKTLLDPTHSYTLSELPGTIYCEHVPSTVRLAETLLHEATHTWLNYAFKVYQSSGFSRREYWSPWRHKSRPVYGILQGAFVFSLLCQFFDACIAGSEIDLVGKAYAASRLNVESQVLRTGAGFG